MMFKFRNARQELIVPGDEMFERMNRNISGEIGMKYRKIVYREFNGLLSSIRRNIKDSIADTCIRSIHEKNV